jgi:hypothetical protein
LVRSSVMSFPTAWFDYMAMWCKSMRDFYIQILVNATYVTDKTNKSETNTYLCEKTY